MPTPNELIALRRAIRQRQIFLENGQAVIQQGAPQAIERLVRANNREIHDRPYTPLFLELIRDKLSQKYAAVGAFSSLLGLPTDSTMPVRHDSDTFYMDFRGGRIETTAFGDPIAIQERVVKVIWTALECQVRQEGQDEIFGTIGGIRTADGSLGVSNQAPTKRLSWGKRRTRSIMRPMFLSHLMRRHQYRRAKSRWTDHCWNVTRPFNRFVERHCGA